MRRWGRQQRRKGKHPGVATDNLRQSVSEVMNNVEEHVATVHCVNLQAVFGRQTHAAPHALCCRLQHTRRDPSITCRSGRGPWSGLQSPAPSHATTPCIPVFAGPPPGYDRAAWRGTLAIYGSEAPYPPRGFPPHIPACTHHLLCATRCPMNSSARLSHSEPAYGRPTASATTATPVIAAAMPALWILQIPGTFSSSDSILATAT